MSRESAWQRWLDAIGAEQRCGELVAPCPLADRPDSGHKEGGDPYKVVISPGRERPVVIYCRCCGRDALYDILSAWGVGSGELQRMASAAGWTGAEAEPPSEYDFDLLHRAYSELLRLCPLTDGDRQWLRRRGVSDELADYCGYGSIPQIEAARHGVCDAMQLLLGKDTDRVPGVRSHFDLRGPGIAIPCRSADGRIRAIKVRLTDGGRTRMRLLSSRRSGGLPAVNDLHFALQCRSGDDGEAWWLTEGERKADVIASQWRARVAAIPGVGCVARGVEFITEAFAQRDNVLLAFDRDAAGEKATATAIDLLRRSSWRGGLLRVVWGEGLKGIDDAIAAGLPLQFEQIALGEPPRSPPHTSSPSSLSEGLGSRPWRESAFRSRFPQFNRDLSSAIRSGSVRLVRVATVGGCVGVESIPESEWCEWIANRCP